MTVTVHDPGNPNSGMMITGQHIGLMRLLCMKNALKAEIQGFRMVRHSVYAQVKRELGFKGNKQKVYDQLLAYIEKWHAANDAGKIPEDNRSGVIPNA